MCISNIYMKRYLQRNQKIYSLLIILSILSWTVCLFLFNFAQSRVSRKITETDLKSDTKNNFSKVDRSSGSFTKTSMLSAHKESSQETPVFTSSRLRFYPRILEKVSIPSDNSSRSFLLYIGYISQSSNGIKLPFIQERKKSIRLFDPFLVPVNEKRSGQRCSIQYTGEHVYRMFEVGILSCSWKSAKSYFELKLGNTTISILKQNFDNISVMQRQTFICLPTLFSKVNCTLLWNWVWYYTRILHVSQVIVYSTYENKQCHTALKNMPILWFQITQLDKMNIHYHGQVFVINEAFMMFEKYASWIGFFDLDEFLVVPTNYSSLSHYLEQQRIDRKKEIFSFGSFPIESSKSEIFFSLVKMNKISDYKRLLEVNKPECRTQADMYLCPSIPGRRKYFCNPKAIRYLNIHRVEPRHLNCDINAHQARILHFRGIAKKI